MDKLEQFQKLLTENPQLMVFVIVCSTIIVLLFLLFLRSLFMSTSTVLAVYSSRNSQRMDGAALSEVLGHLKSVSSEARLAIEELETAVQLKNDQLQQLDSQIKHYQTELQALGKNPEIAQPAFAEKAGVVPKPNAGAVFLSFFVGVLLTLGACLAVYWQIFRK